MSSGNILDFLLEGESDMDASNAMFGLDDIDALAKVGVGNLLEEMDFNDLWNGIPATSSEPSLNTFVDDSVASAASQLSPASSFSSSDSNCDSVRTITSPTHLQELETLKVEHEEVVGEKNQNDPTSDEESSDLYPSGLTRSTISGRVTKRGASLRSKTDRPRGPEFRLSAEEKRIAAKEGFIFPSHYPLTKEQEKNLRRVRRKIRNKKSAQNSRQKKKEYMDTLEAKVKECAQEKDLLAARVKQLEKENSTLSNQLRQLQGLLGRATGKAAPASTALLVILLSCALLMTPNQMHQQNKATEAALGVPQSVSHAAGARRALLSKSLTTLLTESCDGALFPFFNKLCWDGSAQAEEGKRMTTLTQVDEVPGPLMDHDYDPPPSSRGKWFTDEGDPFEETDILKLLTKAIGIGGNDEMDYIERSNLNETTTVVNLLGAMDE
ncbi:unnamed protein product [Cyprideis torosa]|uniref:Uncharacterized protein n=1 Tax=Cyprideis torosa TaxID=163714 RepID=A0A7R8W8P0_9CRUS|nr:unnamed protein product [Cyprideis torosa]CAG0888785.1 unnamed protein product [Cyprideis torosa]